MHHRAAIAAATLAAFFITAAAAEPSRYAMRNGDLYGYEPATTEQDRKAGLQAKPLVMYAYNGQRDGVHQLMQIEPPNNVVTMECARSCSYVTLTHYRGGKHVRTQHVRLVPGSVAAAALGDAWAGNLQRYVDRRNPATLYHVWCNEQKGCAGQAVK